MPAQDIRFCQKHSVDTISLAHLSIMQFEYSSFCTKDRCANLLLLLFMIVSIFP